MIKKIILSIFLLGVTSFNFAQAETITNPQYYIYLDKATIAKGYTVTAFEDNLKLSLVPGILDEDTGVDVMELNEEMPTPWNLEKISDIYQFEFRNKAAYDDANPFYIQFSYNELNSHSKQVYFYDKNYEAWRPLPTVDYPEEKFVRSLIHLPYARIAVFADSDVLTVGKASWYSYKGGDFAASPDYEKGSILRVYNLDYDETSGLAPYVDVEVNDYGPDRNLHPDRVVDLDKVAFGKIAKTSAGIINVRVEPLEINDEEESVLGVKTAAASSTEPELSAKAAIVMDEESGEVIYEKNSDQVLPIASLSKLMAVRTYLGYKNNLDEVVSYKKEDEEKNYEYCAEWESSKVKLNEGDQLTVKDLIYSSLVKSANNTVETLARVSGVSREEFVEKMNEHAREWGATSTNFVEPTGLSTENVSSPADYAIIVREVMKNKIIQEASVTQYYKFFTLNDEEEHSFTNKNSLLFNYRLDILGTKTGYLHEAGYCLVARAKLDDKNVIVVLLNAETRDESFAEVEDLIKFSNFE